MIDLTLNQIYFLKALWDQSILENSEEFEYPNTFSLPDISEEEKNMLEKKELIGWYNGWNISDKGIETYHEQKHKLPYYQYNTNKDR